MQASVVHCPVNFLVIVSHTQCETVLTQNPHRGSDMRIPRIPDMRILKRWVIVFTVCAVSPLLVINFSSNNAMGAPMINDVATDLDNPPVWTTIKKGPLPEEFKAAIRDYYKDLKPLVLTQTSSTYKHGE